MKFFILLTFLTVASCGKYQVGGSLGSVRSISPVEVAQNELANINAICNAIENKAGLALVGTPAVFKFSSKPCNQENFNLPVDVTTTIQNTANGFKFIKNDGSFFFFPDIETKDQGSMAQICALAKQIQLANGQLTTPVKLGNEYIFFTTTGISTNDCKPLANQACISLTKASGLGNGSAQPHTQEWIRFNLSSTQGKLGFFTLKRQITSAACAQGQEFANSAELK